jgi:hypothetical protein
VSAAQAWISERGRCFRMVDDEMGCADHCSAPIVGVGWRECKGHWYPLDACGQHLDQLERRPHSRQTGRTHPKGLRNP